MTKLENVPYQYLFEEFIRRIAKGKDRERLNDGATIMREIDRFYNELERRINETKK